MAWPVMSHWHNYYAPGNDEADGAQADVDQELFRDWPMESDCPV